MCEDEDKGEKENDERESRDPAAPPIAAPDGARRTLRVPVRGSSRVLIVVDTLTST